MANKLIFTHGANFTARFGVASKQNLETRLNQLVAFDAKRGLTTKFVFVDESASVAPFGVKPTNLTTAQAIKGVIDAIAAKAPQDFFLVVGGHDIVPLFEYLNPVSGTTDKTVPSDNGYASSGPSQLPLVPDRLLGRLPTSNDSSPDVLWNQFDEILTFQPPKGAARGYAIYADYWSEPSRNVASQLGIPGPRQSLSPPVDVQPNPGSFPASGLSDGRLHYFNLHGDLRNSPWYGQDGNNLNSYPEACLPALIPPGVRHSVAACEACYGGDSYGTKGVRRTVTTANCLTYLNHQAIGFCGSTTIAYGGTNDAPDLWAADLLVLYFLQNVQAGKGMGAALRDAKVRVAQDAMKKNGAYDDLTKKTLLQFLLYGDPSVAPMPSASGAKSVKGSGKVESLQQLIGPLDAAQPGVVVTLLPPGGPSGAKGLTAKVPALPGKLASGPKRLVYTERRQLTWARPDQMRALRVLGAKGIVSKTVSPEKPQTAEWLAETYEIGMTSNEVPRYFVRVLETTGKDFRLVAQGVSR
jgi:hypothetical protein